MKLSVLKPEKVKERHVACWGCEHATRRNDRFGERIDYCGVLLKAAGLHRRTRASRRSMARRLAFREAKRRVAYLPVIVEQPKAACPIGLHTDAKPEDYRGAGDARPYRKTVREEELESFHRLWAEIHDPGRHWTAEWVGSVRKRLPCGECRREFKAYVEANPIPFGDDQACWDYGVRLHDHVNARLGKPVFGLEAARAKHGPARSNYAKAIEDVRWAEEEETAAAREDRRRQGVPDFHAVSDTRPSVQR